MEHVTISPKGHAVLLFDMRVFSIHVKFQPVAWLSRWPTLPDRIPMDVFHVFSVPHDWVRNKNQQDFNSINSTLITISHNDVLFIPLLVMQTYILNKICASVYSFVHNMQVYVSVFYLHVHAWFFVHYNPTIRANWSQLDFVMATQVWPATTPSSFSVVVHCVLAQSIWWWVWSVGVSLAWPGI